MRTFVRADGKYALFNPLTNEWEGLLKNLIDGDVDIVFAEFAVNRKRFDGADFMMSLSDPKVAFVISGKTVSEVSWTTFISPFHWKIWVCLLLMIGIATTVVWILQKYPQKVFHRLFQKQFFATIYFPD